MCCRFSQEMNERPKLFAAKGKKLKKPNFLHSFFGRIYGLPICLQFYLTFSTTNFAKKTQKLKTLQPMFLYLKDFPQELCDSDMMKLLQFRKMCDVHFHMQPSLDETYATVPCLLSCVRNP